MSSGKTKKVGIITGFYRFRNKKPSKLDGLSFELLARFVADVLNTSYGVAAVQPTESNNPPDCCN